MCIFHWPPQYAGVPRRVLVVVLVNKNPRTRSGDVQIPLANTIRGCLPGRLLRLAVATQTLQTGAKLSFRFKVLSKELWHVLSKQFNINRLGTLWENLVGPHGMPSESSHREALFNYASPPGSSRGCRYGSWFRTCLSQTGAKLSFRFKL